MVAPRWRLPAWPEGRGYRALPRGQDAWLRLAEANLGRGPGQSRASLGRGPTRRSPGESLTDIGAAREPRRRDVSRARPRRKDISRNLFGWDR